MLGRAGLGEVQGAEADEVGLPNQWAVREGSLIFKEWLETPKAFFESFQGPQGFQVRFCLNKGFHD